MNGELLFKTEFIRSIAKSICDISGLLKKCSARMEDMRVYAPFLSDLNKYNNISKAMMRSADLIAEYSKESANLAEVLAETAMIYEHAEESALEISLALTNGMNLKEEKYGGIYQENIYGNFAGGNFDIITKKISSNELFLSDWLSEAVIKFNIFYE